MKLFKGFKYLDVRNIYKNALGDNTPGNILDKVKPLVRKKTSEIIEELKLARGKLKDIPGTNYKLGLHHLKQGNIEDAILRFKMVTYLAPDMADAYYNLGRCQLMNGDPELAKENLQKAILLKSDFPEVNYILGKIKSPESLDAIPGNIIEEHLEWRRESIDNTADSRELIDKIIVTAVLANILDKNPNLEVLDLGCAYGSRGMLLRNKEVVKSIIGVDIYTKATAQAVKQIFEGEPVYNNISNQEISKYLEQNKEKFDVIFAGNVFSYKGKLEGILANIVRSLKPNGIFALVIDQGDIDEGYELDIAKDEFVHSPEYFEETLKTVGFSIIDKKDKDVEGRALRIVIAKNTSN